MLQKLRRLLNLHGDVQELSQKLDSIGKQVAETNWANIYHDSIRGYEELEKLPLNIGRWAGNYSFFYILNRVLKDFKPKNILDMGLGESSKFISTYLKNYLPDSKQSITEHDQKWIDIFNQNYKLPNNSTIVKLELETKLISGYNVNGYKDFCQNLNEIYDLIIIDAPFGSERFSRYDIVDYIKNQSFSNDFVIIFDDTDRQGEKDTLKVVIDLLKEKRQDIFTQTLSGNKSTTIISNLKFLTSL